MTACVTAWAREARDDWSATEDSSCEEAVTDGACVIASHHMVVLHCAGKRAKKNNTSA